MRKLTGLALSLSIVTSSLLAGVNANIKLDPIIEDIVPGKRVVVKATIEDKAGVDVARTYFKSADGANYSFVPMNCEATACSATIPAVSQATKSIDYLVLVKNSDNVVYKTQTFNATILPVGTATPKYQVDPTSEAIQVKTELAKAPQMVEGFSDNVEMDTVEDTARYGIVAGIMNGGAGATTAISAGTVAATGAGIGTTALVVGGVAAVAAGGAVAASNSSGGGGSSTSDNHSDSTYDSTAQVSTAGLNNTTYKVTDQNQQNYQAIINYNSDSTCTYEETLDSYTGNGTCSWSLVNNFYTFKSDGGAEFSGPVNGNLGSFTVSGTYAGGNSGTQTYTRQ